MYFRYERIVFSFSIQKKGSNDAMTAKCTMIYLCGEWLVHSRSKGKYLLWHTGWMANGIHRNPFTRSHFIFHPIYVYAIHVGSSTNYRSVSMATRYREYSAQGYVYIYCAHTGWFSNVRRNSDTRSEGCCLMHCQFIFKQNIALDGDMNRRRWNCFFSKSKIWGRKNSNPQIEFNIPFWSCLMGKGIMLKSAF